MRDGAFFAPAIELGIKPFYYIHEGGYFVFASEIKALLAFPGIRAIADDEAVLSFLVHGNCDYGERTVFRGIKALQASCCLNVDLRTTQCKPSRYYRVESKPGADQSDEEHIEGLRDLLLCSMRKHLISDVRVGSCLSGGLEFIGSGRAHRKNRTRPPGSGDSGRQKALHLHLLL